jgi:hypothetical protein
MPLMSALNRSVLIEGYRCTLEDYCKTISNFRKGHKDNTGVAKHTEFLVRKDAEVEEQKCGFV